MNFAFCKGTGAGCLGLLPGAALLLALLTSCGGSNPAGPAGPFDAVTIRRPADGVAVPGSVTVLVAVTGSRAPVSVELQLDGSRLVNLTSAPWSYSWNTTSLPEGSQHRLVAAATDSTGRSQASAAVTVTIGIRTFSGDYGLFLMNADGTNLRELLPLSVFPISPDISAGGGRVVFTGYTQDLNGDGFLLPGGDDASAEIYLANPDGTGLIRRTTNTFIEYDSRWVPGTPDAIAILYSTNRGGSGDLDLFWERISGGGVQNRTLTAGFSERYPMQQGDLIYHTRFLAGSDPGVGTIWTLHQSTHALEAVTHPAIAGSAPSWLPLGDLAPDLSPDGLTLAFSRSRGTAAGAPSLGKVDLVTLQPPDTSGIEVDLSTSSGADLFPRWSPDGTGILVTDWDPALPSGGQLVLVDPLSGSRTLIGPLPAGLRPIQACWVPGASLVIDATPDILFTGAKVSHLP